ncbi:MAG TPA: glycosyltransferase [Ferruginibacter sp.]|nr:glycosyltransferase [Ferruginibacter sp.]
MTISQPLVSVVLCTYNGEKFLEQQLDSILTQTYSSLEMIICDDASTDSTQQIIKSYALRDKRIQYFFNERNIGVNKNFEQGFLKASGEFIAIADQDDIWKPEKIQKQLALFSSDEIVLVHTGSVIFSGTELPLHKVFKTGELLMQGNDFRKLLLRNTIAGHNIMCKKEIVSYALPLPQSVYYDWWLCETATCYGSIAASGEILAYQRWHESNLTVRNRKGKKQTKKDFIERYAALKAFLSIRGITDTDLWFCKALLSKFQTLEHKRFSLKLFFFLLRNARVMFFYKKKALPYFSYLKAAYYMSFAVKN